MFKITKLFYDSPAEFHTEIRGVRPRLKPVDHIHFCIGERPILTLCDPEIVSIILRYVDDCLAETLLKGQAEQNRKKPAK
jgi:hypothetical protein